MSTVIEGGFHERLCVLRGAARIVVEALQNNQPFVSSTEKGESSPSGKALQIFVDLAQDCLWNVHYDKCRANFRRKIQVCLKGNTRWSDVESFMKDIQLLVVQERPPYENKDVFIAFFMHLQRLLDRSHYYQKKKGG